MITAKTIWLDIERIRSRTPLVHNITNYVVMNSTANALLSIGASPVMAHAIEEVEEMVGIAGTLVINIGTLSEKWIDSMIKAGETAKKRGIPIILDPVGAGATSLRTKTVHELINIISPTIIRGNGSEILSLASAEGTTKGVDSMHGADAAVHAAREISQKFNCTMSISGPEDVILHEDEIIKIKNGHEMMPKVTGLGCTATAITGAFAAVNPSSLEAAAHAMATMGIAGEIAAEKSEGPGSLQVHFLDTLYRLNEQLIGDRLQVAE